MNNNKCKNYIDCSKYLDEVNYDLECETCMNEEQEDNQDE